MLESIYVIQMLHGITQSRYCHAFLLTFRFPGGLGAAFASLIVGEPPSLTLANDELTGNLSVLNALLFHRNFIPKAS